jgi:phage host-nuclease inhibitor protein Gam
MLFGHKNKLQVDLGDLQNEKERLAKFLQTNLNTPVHEEKNKIAIESENLSILDLQKEVTKYVHRHNLSRAYWVSAEGKTVKFNRFKGHVKKKELKKEQPTQGLTQSWGL